MGAQAAVDQRHQLREVRGRREGAHVEALQRQGDAERVSDCVWSCAPGAVSSFGYKLAGMFSGSNRWSQTRCRGNFAVPMHALVDAGGPCGFANDGEVEAQPHLQLEQPLSRRGGPTNAAVEAAVFATEPFAALGESPFAGAVHRQCTARPDALDFAIGHDGHHQHESFLPARPYADEPHCGRPVRCGLWSPTGGTSSTRIVSSCPAIC